MFHFERDECQSAEQQFNIEERAVHQLWLFLVQDWSLCLLVGDSFFAAKSLSSTLGQQYKKECNTKCHIALLSTYAVINVHR